MITTEHIISKSLLAGICIGIGCYISLLNTNQIVNSFLFSFGFLLCSIFELNLFTDRINDIAVSSDFRRLFLILILNIISVVFTGIIISALDSDIISLADNYFLENKYNIPYMSIIVKSFIAGLILSIPFEFNKFNKQNNYIIFILCCVAVYLIGGFHIIADLFYYSASSLSINNIGFVLLTTLITLLFNFIGCNFINLFINKSFMH